MNDTTSVSVEHRLTPLLAPRSMAFVGASTRPHSVGNQMIKEANSYGFKGPIYPVNPKYETVEGLTCYPSLADLPGPVDHVVIAVANPRVEAQLAAAAEIGARAATVFASGYYEGDTEPPLTERIRDIAKDAGMQMCGGNCIGFYNFEAGACASSYSAGGHGEPGHITLVTHSGTLLWPLVEAEHRLSYNLAVSSGQELVTTAADYLDYALDRPSTRLVAMFLETVRDPEGFIAGLEKARARDVPVVVLKVGRTAESAALAVSHSGAIAGDDAAYQAVFDRYGVARVDDVQEMAATMMLMSHERRPAKGGIAAMLDSGGIREMLIDLAAIEGVPIADIAAGTRDRLASKLHYGLEPINPLDAWGTDEGSDAVFGECFQALVDDDDTALAVLVTDRNRDGSVWGSYTDICERAAAHSTKPVILITNHKGSAVDPGEVTLARRGLPILDGLAPALSAIRHAFAYRGGRARADSAPPAPPEADLVDRWRARLGDGEPLDEADALALIGDFGVPVVPAAVADDAEAAVAAAEALGYPVALKTAMPGLAHKSDTGGVALGLADSDAVRAAHADIAARLGSRVVIQPMAAKGVEMVLGMVRDAQFGPLVMVGAGGILVETLKDTRFALPPFGVDYARRLIDGLKVRPLLDGLRGAPAADVDALAEALARFSVLAVTLGEVIAEIDVNPFIAGPAGPIAVDALVVADPTGH